MDRAERRDERIVVNREFDSVADFVREYVTNLSRSGAFVKSDSPLPVGTRVTLKFSVLSDDVEVIEGVGEVVRVVPPGGGEEPGMGVVFTELASFSQTLIERLLVRAGFHEDETAAEG
jgi:uncharacterized protein (TIGR02266 family)